MAGRSRVTAPAVGKAPKPTEGTAPLLVAKPEFVAIEMPAPAKTATRASLDPAVSIPTQTADLHIHVELRRGPVHLNVRWPTTAADDCTAWLRELTTGLLK